MPTILPNTTTADAYPTSGGASLGLGDVFASGYFVVANAAVFCQYQHGLLGQADFSNDLYLPPATYPLYGTNKDPLGGIRFKSAVTGVPAQVFGVLYKKDESSLLAGSEFGASVSSSGSIAPGTALINGILGIVTSAGVKVSGSGYNVNRTGVGIYVITFANPMASIPICLANALDATLGIPTPITRSINGFTVDMRTAGNLALDLGFNFAAIAVQ